MDIRREDDIEQLRRIALTQQTQIRVLLDVLQRKSQEVDALKGEDGDLQETLRHLNELQAQAQKLEEAKPAPKKRKKRRRQKGHGPKPQPKLERDQQLFELDEADQTCPSCGGELVPLDGQFEQSELVDVIDISYRLVEVKRQKYACRCGGCVETAIGPDRAVDGGRYSLAFAVKVAVDKYVDHIPLTRQSRILKRWGLEVGSQTLWDQVLALSGRLRPCYDALRERVLASPVLGLDQTSWKRLNRKGTPWQMWCLTTEDVVWHSIRDDKAVTSWNAILGDYEGIAVLDAMKTHGAAECNKPGPTLAGCWAHVVRKFRDAESDFPEAHTPRDLIRQLYEIEERAETREHLAQLRDTESRKVLDELEEWLLAQTTLKTTSLGEAIRYAVGYWPRLKVFLSNPDVPLDNNRTERGIRGPVVGRKNHYGSRSEKGTMVAAIFYSLVETAKLVGIDPARYLAEAAAAAKGGRVLLPHELAAR